MKSLKGQLLLDGGTLTGSPFHRTVVLICSHDSEGAFGLVLNRRTTKKMEDVLTVTLPDAVRESLLHLGSPVRPELLSCLVHDPAINGTTDDIIMPGLRLSHTLDDLAEPSGSASPQAQFKFFAGYAGWAAGQLDNGSGITFGACGHGEPPCNICRSGVQATEHPQRLVCENPQSLRLPKRFSKVRSRKNGSTPTGH